MFVFAVWAKVLVGVSAVAAISAPVIYTVANKKVVAPVKTKNKPQENTVAYVMTLEEQKQFNEYKKQKLEKEKAIEENQNQITNLTKDWHVSEVARTSSQAKTNDFEWAVLWRKDFVKGIKEKYESLKNQTNALTNIEDINRRGLDELIEKQEKLSKEYYEICKNMDKLSSGIK